MAHLALSSDERIGLAGAIAVHAGLFAWLALGPVAQVSLPLPERMTVTLSEDVGLTSTAQQPRADPAPETAPQLGTADPMPTRPQTHARAAAIPPTAAAPPRPAPTIARLASVKPATVKPAGASRIGNDFLKGVAGAQVSGKSPSLPATTVGPAVRSALAGAISRQLKPKWAAPQGAEADKLITYLTWDLAADGALVGSPRVVRQDGITDANRAQAARHAEQAVRAVRLASPFQLPAEFHAAWQHVAEFRFDRKLSQ